MYDAIRKIVSFLLTLACAPVLAEWVEVARADEHRAQPPLAVRAKRKGLLLKLFGLGN